MNAVTSMHRIDVIYLNDKGESLAEGEPHQSYTCITLLRYTTGRPKRHNVCMDKHRNSTVQAINHCKQPRGRYSTLVRYKVNIYFIPSKKKKKELYFATHSDFFWDIVLTIALTINIYHSGKYYWGSMICDEVEDRTHMDMLARFTDALCY